MSRSALLVELGGEDGCFRLAETFYSRVAADPVLRPLFPGKSLRCAIEEFSAFLIQFFEGGEDRTQFRWRLSLRESHARFSIGEKERAAWLRLMSDSLDELVSDGQARAALREFFTHSSAYIIRKDSGTSANQELAQRWIGQRDLDRAVAAIQTGDDDVVIAELSRLLDRPSVRVGLMARMVESRRHRLVRCAMEAVESDASLMAHRYAGRTLLHYAASAGCIELVCALLRPGVDADIRDNGGHTPLYRVSNECAWPSGAEIVRILVGAGADVNAINGVTRATALHMAARRGFVEIAEALLKGGADAGVRDRKGDTPLMRAKNCRKAAVVRLLSGVEGR